MSSDGVTRPHAIRAPTVMWQAWGRVCKRLETNRTARILDLLRSDIEKHGDDQDRADLAAGEQELAERRARLHPGRPKKRTD